MGFETVNINQLKGLQSILIPKGMEIDDDKVYLKKIGNIIYVIPFHNPWKNFFDSLTLFSDDFMNERNQPENQDRESFD